MKMKTVHFQNRQDESFIIFIRNSRNRNHRTDNLTKDIWRHFLILNFTMTAEYLHSSVEADWQTRKKIRIETSSKMFHKICKVKGASKLDLFASGLSNQLPKYMAWRPNPYSKGTDAM